MAKHRKKPKLAPTTSPSNLKKVPPSSAESPDSEFRWNFSKVDKDGHWGVNNLTCSEFLEKVWSKIWRYEGMKWGTILTRERKHVHPIPKSRFHNVNKNARKLLSEFNYEIEYLYSFRISRKERVWGIRDGAICYFLWWDPNHEILRTDK